MVAYIDARAAMNRLDRVVGVDGWSDAYEVLEAGTVKCRLTVLGISKEDTGIGEDLKAAFSDALKRAAVKFGVGRYLYDLPTVWAPLDERGRMVDAGEVKGRMLGFRPPIPRYVGPNGG